VIHAAAGSVRATAFMRPLGPWPAAAMPRLRPSRAASRAASSAWRSRSAFSIASTCWGEAPASAAGAPVAACPEISPSRLRAWRVAHHPIAPMARAAITTQTSSCRAEKDSRAGRSVGL
jgi:hypothetical protein